MHYHCLIIDDEEALAEATSEYFNAFDVKTAFAVSAAEGIAFFEKNTAEVLLLDINLQDESGFSLCETLRKTSNLPILFISARQSDDDVLRALNIGGDDYIKKPYALSVLLAKVRAVLKRQAGTVKTAQSAGGFEVDPPAMRVYKQQRDLNLKTMEFKLFYYLFENRNRVVTKQELFQNVWGDSFFSDGTLNVHIRRLREKVESDPNRPAIITTVWGTGYRMEL